MLRAALFVAASLIVGVSAEWHCDAEYKKYLEEFPSKSYSPEKETAFCSNFAQVQQHNSQNSRFTMGINAFSDWTDEELKVLLGAVESNQSIREFPPFEPKTTTVATSKDWRGQMPAVKDQGHCGSCWAFSAIAVVDFWGGSHSEQELVDCTAGSCKGYMASSALDYLTTHGAETEDQYPYMAFKQSACQYKSGGKEVSNVRSLSGATRIEMAVNEQVVSVSIHLSSKGPFMKYSSGVYDADCGTGEGHAIAIVGYSGDDYWIIRNSWASSWGVEGHIYFKKGVDLCSVESWAPVTADVISTNDIQV
jgi:C1A family cysteine protease